MGGSSSKEIFYAEPITEPQQGETAIYRNAEHTGELLTTPGNYSSIQDLYLELFEEDAVRPFLGYRKWENGQLEDKFRWYSTGDVKRNATALGSGLINLDLVEEKAQFQNFKINFVGIYAKNSIEWMLIDIANTLYNFTTMPIYDTLGEEATEYMFDQTELKTCFLTCNHAGALVERIASEKLTHLKHLVIMDEWNLTDELREKLNQIKWYTISQIIENGMHTSHPYRKPTPDSVFCFSYTSGTTGAPKGAMITHKNILAGVAGALAVIPIKKGDALHLSYLPLAHVFERIVAMWVICRGGRIAFFGGDVFKVKDDLAILKPTIFVSVPRLFNKFHAVMRQKIDSLEGNKKKLADRAIRTKQKNYRTKARLTHWLHDKLVFKKMKGALGGKVQYLLSGSAPISDEVKEFLSIAFSAPLVEGYGQTEGLGGMFLQHPEDNTPGIVGGPLPHLEYKLIDVPEMNYYSTDKDEEGRLRPRGEICVRGASIIPGYYKNEAKTAEAIDADGWLHSGDIGMILPGSNALKIFDRRKNIFKLSQGEYIAPDKLEQVYKGTKGIADIFVYGKSDKSHLIAIVNYDPNEILEVSKPLGIEETDFEMLCKNEELKEHILKELAALNKRSGLKGFERIKKIYVEPQTFDKFDLITTSYKLKRHLAKEHFKDQLEELYVGLD